MPGIAIDFIRVLLYDMLESNRKEVFLCKGFP